MTGSDLKLSGTRQDFDTQTNQPIVTMQFTKKGAKKFAEITRAEAQRGKLLSNTIGGGQKIEQHFAIVLDREIKSWPSIDWEQYPGGISGSNGAQITGIGNLQEAKDLALVLQTGALPVKFVTLDQTAISATLGKDSLNEAKKAAIVGLLVVALFLLVFYRFLGLVAVLGLGIYAAFLYAAILLFNVTLTLPGFAGLVLTLGVAADANVVIFERIKEEARAGRSVKAAIQTGLHEGLCDDRRRQRRHRDHRARPLRGRDIVGARLRPDAADRYRDLDAHRRARDARVPLAARRLQMPREPAGDRHLRRRHPALAEARLHRPPPALVRDLGRGDRGRDRLALGIRGLNLGIDFKGGTQMSFKTPVPVALDTVRAQTAKVGQSNAHIQGRGASTNDSYKSFQILTKTLTTDEAAQFQSNLTKRRQGRRIRDQERVVELRPPDREDARSSRSSSRCS